MQIKLAASYGFCFGVKRAIKIAENTQNASTIGPLIHNNEEINRLRENFNVKTLHDISEAQNVERAIIRTHGIPKKDLETLMQSKVEVINATCPYVTKPQEICEKMSQEGYDIVIFGDANHPEVKGVESYAIHGAYVVQSVNELEKIKFRGNKIAVVSQTTRKISEFLEITGYLQMRYKEVRVFNTICNATFENQDAARELAKEADVVIVIGGKNSSNTKQLHSICKEYCTDSFLVESEKDLDPAWFEGKQLCGVTAGASTPDWIIEKIVGKINEIKV
jgi:4-hydroxy-3-methylbut-2-enyl diphosphate reductase